MPMNWCRRFSREGGGGVGGGGGGGEREPGPVIIIGKIRSKARARCGLELVKVTSNLKVFCFMVGSRGIRGPPNLLACNVRYLPDENTLVLQVHLIDAQFIQRHDFRGCPAHEQRGFV